MIEQVLAVVIQLSVATSVYLSRKGYAAGWWVGCWIQVVNLVYGLWTHHWGFLLGLVLVAPQFLMAGLDWQRKKRARAVLAVR